MLRIQTTPSTIMNSDTPTMRVPSGSVHSTDMNFGLTTLTGLSTSQLISLVIGITALIVLIVRRRRAQQVAKTDELVANGARA